MSCQMRSLAHYWTGKGRTILTVKWIPPVFVCGEKELPIKIHKIS